MLARIHWGWGLTGGAGAGRADEAAVALAHIPGVVRGWMTD